MAGGVGVTVGSVMVADSCGKMLEGVSVDEGMKGECVRHIIGVLVYAQCP